MTNFFRVFILFIFVPAFSYTQSQDLKFEHLTVDDGLSNNFISDIVQDSSGFMWFATEDGLNKYDGYTFTIYRHDPANPIFPLALAGIFLCSALREQNCGI